MDLNKFIADVPDFPKPGILFKDITPLMANGEAYQFATNEFVAYAKLQGATLIVGPEARGFILVVRLLRKWALALCQCVNPVNYRGQRSIKNTTWNMVRMFYRCTTMPFQMVRRC
jgi:Adenine/guanine phosphoribosyltransferases and related PRPP-binding proteins